MDRTYPNGRVIGIDIIPAQPPKGVSTIQGNFLSPLVQEEVKKLVRDANRDRSMSGLHLIKAFRDEQSIGEELSGTPLLQAQAQKRAKISGLKTANIEEGGDRLAKIATDEMEDRLVDVVLSDMSEPWAQVDGFWKRSLSDPYYRMMNTSGMSFRDHAGSMVCWKPLNMLCRG